MGELNRFKLPKGAGIVGKDSELIIRYFPHGEGFIMLKDYEEIGTAYITDPEVAEKISVAFHELAEKMRNG
jgi:hypothetical protein